MKRDVLNVLIRKSSIIELESNDAPFSHNLDQLDDLNPAFTSQRLNDHQYFYNKAKGKALIGADSNAINKPKNVQFSKVASETPERQEEEEYKPKLLNQEDIKIDIEKNFKDNSQIPNSNRSIDSLVPDESKRN